MVKYDISIGFVRTVFSYRLLIIIEPTWSIEAPEVNLEMIELPKANTTDHVYQALFNELRASKSSECEQMYTDGAKSETIVGAAVVWRNAVRTTALPKQATIYTAELHAVKLALNVFAEQRMLKSVIFSDSYSLLVSLKRMQHDSPLARRVQHRIHRQKWKDKI